MRTLPLTLLVLLLPACGSAATPQGLPRLAEQLRADGEAVTSKMSDAFDEAAPEVAEDASEDQACTDDGTKRVFRATGEATAQDDPSGDQGLVETILVGSFQERGYEIERFPTNDSGAREYTFGKDRLEFSASVESGATTSYEVVGQTPCLG
jgi:hypothetical protein